MAKQNEALEDILDDLHDLKTKVASRDSDIVFIRQWIEKQSEQSNAQAAQPKVGSITDNELKSKLRDALVSALNHVRLQNNIIEQPSLSDYDYQKLSEIVVEKYEAITKETNRIANAELEAKHAKVQEEFRKKREAQGFNTVEQVAEWAPEYPYPIQRFMRYLGVLLFSVDEDPDKMKECVKAFGDVMLAASHCKVPSLWEWIKYRWNQVRNYAHKKLWLTYYLMFNLGLFSIVGLAIYQNKVMNLHETNLIWRKTHIQTKEEIRRWNEVDSILHKNNGFYDKLKNER